MLIPVESWTQEFVRRLLECFPKQVVFAGLQGSYRRGEATEKSDIDLVVVLEEVGLEELRAYRTLVRGMEYGERACGFLCGRSELEGWPRFDLLQLALDTAPLYGSLDSLVSFTAADLEEAIQVGASALYHAAVHTYLYSPRPEEELAALEKSLFFLVRLEHYWKSGHYPETRQESEALLGPQLDAPEERYARMIRLSSAYLQTAPNL